MKGEGCGGHGRDDHGWIRKDGCEMCGRHDWFIWASAAQEAVARAICYTSHCQFRDFRMTARPMPFSWADPAVDADMGWYEAEKSHWRTAGMMIEVMIENGFVPTPAPTACAREGCGLPPSDRVHMNIYDSHKHGPADPNQHPFEV